MTVTTKNIIETERLAKEFIKKNKKIFVNSKTATIIGLYGDLGSGKTTFVKGIAKAFGLQQTVTSPTFVIEKIYKLDKQQFDYLIHIDAYRLERGEELLHLGWNDISKNSKNIIFVEWTENVKDILPDDMMRINFEVIGEEERKIEIKI